ncbi:MAG TPA: hypothetical protein VFM55_16480 [Micromonosporaceae bacterium]|nr:hypothetical protein [Micromonosporaceae bacterium]
MRPRTWIGPAVGALVLGLTLAVPAPAHAAASCAALAPAADAAANRVAIQSCLDGPERQAVLTPGTYPVEGGIVVRSGARLLGDTTYPTIRLVSNPGATARLVRLVGSGARVGFLRLDAGNLLTGGCCTAVVMFEGAGSNDNLLDDSFITGAPEHTGVYLLCSSCRGNQMLRVNIHGNFYGVIFGPFNSAAYANTLVDSQVHDNRCDGVTFMGTDLAAGRPGGYGVVDNSALYRNGRDCENGIPGAAVYTAGNLAGARITNSQLYENCGNNLDLVDAANFHIEGNSIHTPGYPVPGAVYYCTATGSAALVNVRDFQILRNDVRNTNTRTMLLRSGDPNRFFNADGAPRYSDLPGGGYGLVAFVLASWRTGTPSMHNTIESNTFIGGCASPCVGTGYFATRNTGFNAARGWSASTTNYYRGNNPFGSNVGSRRGGGNWYAADTSCPSSASPYPCNRDDYQHPTSVNWARNDGFFFYS